MLEYNVISSQNKTKFICFCWSTDISNYNYMLRPFLLAIIRLYIPSFKSYVQYAYLTMFDDEVSNILIYNVIYNKLCWFSVDFKQIMDVPGRFCGW
jgi:hypothetical protein